MILKQLWATIKQTATKATETIKYGMPAFVLNENPVYFSACKNHIGIYPTASGIVSFEEVLCA